MGEAKNRKNEINNLKNGACVAINDKYDDYDNAGLIIQKVAKFNHYNIGKDSYSYNITDWMGKDVKGIPNEEFIKVVADTKILGEKNKVLRVKNAIVVLLEGFNMNYAIGQLPISSSKRGGNIGGRVTNQEELDYAVNVYFSPMNRQDICTDTRIVA